MANGNGSKWIRKDRRLAIYLRDGFTCQYCGVDLHHASPFDVTLDHLDPRSNGGGHETRNLVTACRSCNSSRQDKPWREYATGGAIDRIVVQRELSIKETRILAKALIAGRTGGQGS